MVVASGTSARHVGSLADNLKAALKDKGLTHIPVEGQEVGDWVLVDVGNIVVHLFRPEVRSYYNLEKMWSVSIPQHAELEAAY
jgi:ribosome-associated protein